MFWVEGVVCDFAPGETFCSSNRIRASGYSENILYVACGTGRKDNEAKKEDYYFTIHHEFHNAV